jgi:UDP-N-acetyl-D-galactosamine dehydrogenase
MDYLMRRKEKIEDGKGYKEEVKKEYGASSVQNMEELPEGGFDAVILAVGHRNFLDFPVRKWGKENAVVFDIKGILPKEVTDGRL